MIANAIRFLLRTKVSQLAMPAQKSRAAVEGLERRQMLVAGPVVAQEFIGTFDAVTSLVLTFDQPLDPVTAQNPDAYEIVKKFREEDDGFFGSGETESSSERVRIESAVYDADANTVTLTSKNSFAPRRTFTVVVVRGKGPNAVLTPGGEALDGDGNGKPGGDLKLRYKATSKKTLTYREADGDRVKIKVEGAGKMFYFYAKRGKSSPSIFLRETDLATSIVTGEVKQGKKGDGIADIAQVIGTSTAQVTLLTNSAFRIRSVVPIG